MLLLNVPLPFCTPLPSLFLGRFFLIKLCYIYTCLCNKTNYSSTTARTRRSNKRKRRNPFCFIVFFFVFFFLPIFVYVGGRLCLCLCLCERDAYYNKHMYEICCSQLVGCCVCMIECQFIYFFFLVCVYVCAW